MYKLFIGNIPYTCTEKELIDLFIKYDGFVNLSIARKGNISSGFGYVTFKTEQNMLDVLNNIISINDRLLKLEKFEDKRHIYRIYIKNININASSEDIEKIIGMYDKSAKVLNISKKMQYNKSNAIVSLTNKYSFVNLVKIKELSTVIGNLNISSYKPQHDDMSIEKAYATGYMTGKMIGYQEALDKLTKK